MTFWVLVVDGDSLRSSSALVMLDGSEWFNVLDGSAWESNDLAVGSGICDCDWFTILILSGGGMRGYGLSFLSRASSSNCCAFTFRSGFRSNMICGK